MAQVTITVDNGQWPDFQKYYLKRRPIPLDEEQQPIMSVGAWIKQCTVDDIYRVLLAGKQMEAFNELLNAINIDIT